MTSLFRTLSCGSAGVSSEKRPWAIGALALAMMCFARPQQAEAVTVVVAGAATISGASGTTGSYSYSMSVTDAPVEHSECTVHTSDGQAGPWSGAGYHWDSPDVTGGIIATVEDTGSSSATLNIKFIKPGDYTVSVGGGVSYSSTCGDDSDGDSKTVAVHVTEGSKTWTAGSGDIGKVYDPDTLEPKVDEHGKEIVNGRMVAPIDMTKDPVTPDKLAVAPLTRLSCGAEAATDTDKWTIDRNSDGSISSDKNDNERGIDSDVLVTTWTSTIPDGGGGGFVLRDSEGNETLVSSIASNASNYSQWTGLWQAPSTPQNCSVGFSNDDTKAVVSPDTGSRDDEAKGNSADIVVYSASVHFVSSNVAVGSVDDDAHKAAFYVLLTDKEGHPLPGVKVAAGVDVISGGCGPVDAGNPGPQDDAITATASLDTPPPADDSGGTGGDGTDGDGTGGDDAPPSPPPTPATDGEGKVYGTFKSGNRIEPATILVRLNGDQSGPAGSVSQVWNEMDTDSRWTYDPYFEVDEPSLVGYSIKYKRNGGTELTPVSGHSVSFVTTSITGQEWDSTTGFDWDGDGEVDGDYDVSTTYSAAAANAAYDAWDQDAQPDAPPVAWSKWNQWKGLSSFGTVSEASGTYSAEQTVSDGEENQDGFPSFWVNSVGFDMVDSSSYSAYSPGP